MKYIVMETKLGYAIVMDSKGRFSKVVNLDYEVGQELEDVLSFEMENTRKRRRIFIVTTFLIVVICLCITVWSLDEHLDDDIPNDTSTHTHSDNYDDYNDDFDDDDDHNDDHNDEHNANHDDGD